MRLLAFAALAQLVQCAPAGDLVTSLPGWNGPLPSKVYSGFISAGSDEQDGITYDVQLYYIFIEAENTTDPTTAPLMLWSNGGPGAPSSYGLFTELGPLYLDDTSAATEPPSLFRNPYAWTGLASVLILNGPAPVGFSFCAPSGPSGSGLGGAACGSWNDTRTALFNQRFVNNWFKAFPEYETAPFFIVGESYAGVYLGQLTTLLLDQSPPRKIHGLALGDACMGTDVFCGKPLGGPWYDLLFKVGHGCSTTRAFEAVLVHCPVEVLKHTYASEATPACTAAVAAFHVECPSNSYYAYNYVDQCADNDVAPPPTGSARITAAGGPPVGPAPPAQPTGYPCGGGTALTNWITRADVKAALHVPADSQYFAADNGNGPCALLYVCLPPARAERPPPHPQA
jgi:hypothetical protein